jgi:hypothetical protein
VSCAELVRAPELAAFKVIAWRVTPDASVVPRSVMADAYAKFVVPLVRRSLRPVVVSGMGTLSVQGGTGAAFTPANGLEPVGLAWLDDEARHAELVGVLDPVGAATTRVLTHQS